MAAALQNKVVQALLAIGVLIVCHFLKLPDEMMTAITAILATAMFGDSVHKAALGHALVLRAGMRTEPKDK